MVSHRWFFSRTPNIRTYFVTWMLKFFNRAYFFSPCLLSEKVHPLKFVLSLGKEIFWIFNEFKVYIKMLKFNWQTVSNPLLISTKKSIWKNQVWQSGFLVYFKLDFTACAACKNQVWNWFLKAKNPVRRIWFSKIHVQINWGIHW